MVPSTSSRRRRPWAKTSARKNITSPASSAMGDHIERGPDPSKWQYRQGGDQPVLEEPGDEHHDRVAEQEQQSKSAQAADVGGAERVAVPDGAGKASQQPEHGGHQQQWE